MWATGMITADCHYWTDGMESWQPVEELGLDGSLQLINQPVINAPPALPTQQQTHEIHHSGQVTTKSKGSRTVAMGSIMCIVGIFVVVGGAERPVFAVIGALLLVVGFFVAVVGRLMS